MKVPVDKIGEVIGPKGKVINQIQDDTGAQISIEDDGTIYVGADNGEAAEAARATINAIANPQMPEVGERYLGTVVKTTAFGAFVSLLPGKDGLLHISQAARPRRRQAGRERRGRRLGRSEAPGRDRRDRRPRQAVAGSRRRGRLSLGDSRTPDRRPHHAIPLSPADQPLGSTRTLLKETLTADRRVPWHPRSAVPCCPAGSGSSPRRCPARARRRSGSGRRSAPATSRARSSGATHFLEHLLFKGTKRRTALDISAELDAVGGELNAFTGKEYTCYHARVLDADVPLAIDVICDMVDVLADADPRGRERAQRDPRRDRDARRRP